jgi:hypothetical protein
MDQDPAQKTGFLITGEDAQRVNATRIRVALELMGLKEFDIAVVPVLEEAMPAKSELLDTTIGSSEQIQTLAYEPRPRGELYSRLVDLSRVPQVPKLGSAVARIVFEGGTAISLNDSRHLFLSPHELFTFNALLINRDHPLTLDDLMELGYFPDSANPKSRRGSFSPIKNRLRSLLILPGTGRPIIKEFKTSGSLSKSYQFDPEIELALRDLRRQPE